MMLTLPSSSAVLPADLGTRSGPSVDCVRGDRREGWGHADGGFPDPGRRILGLNFIATKQAGSVPQFLLGVSRLDAGWLLLLGVLKLFEPESKPGQKYLLPMIGLGRPGLFRAGLARRLSSS